MILPFKQKSFVPRTIYMIRKFFEMIIYENKLGIVRIKLPADNRERINLRDVRFKRGG